MLQQTAQRFVADQVSRLEAFARFRDVFAHLPALIAAQPAAPDNIDLPPTTGAIPTPPPTFPPTAPPNHL